MSNRGRNFRRRADEDENETVGKSATNGITSPPTSSKSATNSASKSAAAAAKVKKESQKVPKLLSFAEDGDADEGLFSRHSSKKTPSSRPAKSTMPASGSGHKITSNKDRVRPSASSLPSIVQPQAGTYTIEALRELQKNTKTLASSRPAVVDEKSEPVIVLKGLLKPVKSVADTLREVDDLGEEDNRDINDKGAVQGRLNSLKIGKGNAADSSIPDQATIEMIRAKRERLRQSRAAAPDYIALDGGSNHGEAEGLSDDEPEFLGRIKMFGATSDKKGVFEGIEERDISPTFGKDNDGNDEEKIWEEEQFRKGLGKRMDDGPSRLATSNVPLISSVHLSRCILILLRWDILLFQVHL